MDLYNTLTRRKEAFVPVQDGRVTLYSCGPTVYRYIHIGNLRTFTMADWLRRALTRQGLRVHHVKNITDVGHLRIERLDQGEDKLEAQARKEGRSATEIAAFYTEAFLHDEQRLNILPADVFPRASQHVAEMIAMIQQLEARGLAYNVGGNVFFDVKRFAGYGELSGNLFEGLLAGVHDTADDGKRHGEDFPLWKVAEPGREMAWDSPWGVGFPGWHIECSAMATRYLGERIDLHTGGVDNIFPHHENERAQSEGAIGRRWVSHWVHAQHLLTDGLKMAKSTGNDYTLDEVLGRGYEPLALRYLFTTAHYRARLNFTFTALTAAQTALRRLRLAAATVADAHDDIDPTHIQPWHNEFDAAIADDLNLPRAMAVVWRMTRRPDAELSHAERRHLLASWDEVLGLDLFAPAAVDPAPQSIVDLVTRRDAMRQTGQYAAADQLRQSALHEGWELRDTPSGTIVLPQPPGSGFPQLTHSAQAPDHRAEPDRCEFSINLLARNSREDLERCLDSIARHAAGVSLEVVVVDNGSTDDTLRYMHRLARDPQLLAPDGTVIPVNVLFADHNLGWAGGRNASMRASTGRYVVLLDTSIEIDGDIWTPLAAALDDPNVGVVGPFGLVTEDLREFAEAPGPEVDAIEGYLLAFRRPLLEHVGLIDEKFRFYRLADIYWSFFFKAAGLSAQVSAQLAERLIKHPHREYYSLTPEERATKSKKNYDMFRDRWHHGESLLVANAAATERWRGHDDERHIAATHTHSIEELPPPGQAHCHPHRHLADHEHEHWHFHEQPSPTMAALAEDVTSR